MTLQRTTCPNSQQSFHHALSLAEGFRGEGEYPVLLVSTFELADHYRKALAEASASFGATVSTLGAWVADRWELFGDGTRVVSPIQRQLLVARSLDERLEAAGSSCLARSPGTIMLLSAMAQEGLSSLSGYFGNQAAAAEHGLTDAECEALATLRSYAGLLHGAGLCEPTEAMEALARQPWPVPPLVLEGPGFITEAEQGFLDALGERAEVHLVEGGMGEAARLADGSRAAELVSLQDRLCRPDGAGPLAPTGAVRFLLPAGRYAAPRLIEETLLGLEPPTRVLLAACSPEEEFSLLAPALASHGIEASLSARKAFAETGFGTAFLSLVRFMQEPSASPFVLGDFTRSPFSTLSPRQACRLDAKWRGSRLTDRDRCLGDLAAANDALSSMVGSLKESDFKAVLSFFERVVMLHQDIDEPYRAEQLAALSVARRHIEAADGLGLPFSAAMTFLRDAAVPLGMKLEGTAGTRVDFVGFRQASYTPACSYDVLVVCDLDAGSLPVRDRHDAKTLLFEKLGIPQAEDALEQSRRDFFRMLSVPTAALYCERTLNDEEANPTYPAVMLEELADCYRPDPSSVADLDKNTRLPLCLLPFAVGAGEGELYRNLSLSDHAQDVLAYERLPLDGEIGEEGRGRIVLPKRAKDASAQKPLLSPSAIETYLECPYKWFAIRRLCLKGLDAGFGPVEKGNFAHALLKTFYVQFQKDGFAKVDGGNIDEAKALMAEVFRCTLEHQYELKPDRAPLIPLSEMDNAEILAFEKQMGAYLDREAQLLPGFVPQFFEQGFGEQGDFEYAGALLHGQIDRIDVNGKGQAVVIDYKGSINRDYALMTASELPWTEGDGLPPARLPHKVQSLVYAQAARKLFSLDVVGALYLSYNPDGGVFGAYDGSVLGPESIPGIKPDLCSMPPGDYAGFGALLDRIEEGIAQALRPLLAGYIAPSPRGGDPCGFCPVLACKARGAHG